ncbi:MAG: 50S ribosomal protein L2 [Candidatus Pacebacteria bacterium]|nr:50S ribosomal protein L2 [Candidatus Paceibacterota bacterium]
MKSYNPTTPSRRHMTGISFKKIFAGKKNEPLKKLSSGFKRAMGRNGDGRITTRHKGGGSKRTYRFVDFVYDKKNIPARIESVEYDPNRTGFIALCVYADGEKRYVLVPQSMKKGDTFTVSEKAEVKAGNRMPLGKIPSGTMIYNIEFHPLAGAKLVRSAGSYAELLAHDAGYSQIKMPSKEVRKVHDKCWASIGAVSNEEHNLINIGKAGRSRWLGIRPTVRGTAMNPVDHPHGGGEGRQPRGLKRPKNLWGKGTRGVKTRDKKKYSSKFIISRRVTKKKK